nr:MAG TPA: hypothetical protein [Caudoviricetes sp.]
MENLQNFVFHISTNFSSATKIIKKALLVQGVFLIEKNTIFFSKSKIIWKKQRECGKFSLFLFH